MAYILTYVFLGIDVALAAFFVLRLVQQIRVSRIIRRRLQQTRAVRQ